MQTINDLLDQIRSQLDLTSETEHEVLAEIRTHIEDALDTARSNGENETLALHKVAESFGLEQVGSALQEVHAPWESADAILACALPVLFAIILRWLVFAPDGTLLAWTQILTQPALWLVALAGLCVPLIQFRRWRYALVSWGVFWCLSLIFVIFPVASNW